MKYTGLTVIGLWLLWGTLGCANSQWNFWHPGSAPEQQRRAERFDPYPQADIGPALPGTRPRDFDRPYPEPVRNQWDNPPPQARIQQPQ